MAVICRRECGQQGAKHIKDKGGTSCVRPIQAQSLPTNVPAIVLHAQAEEGQGLDAVICSTTSSLAVNAGLILR